MSVVAEFAIPAEAVPGGETLAALPAATVRLERVVPSDEAVHPLFWMTGVEVERFLGEMRAEDGITDVQRLVRLDDATLFRATWVPDVAVIEGIETLRATILDAVGTADGWVFRVIAEERERLQAFQRIFAEQDIPVELRRITEFSEDAGEDSRLTTEQRRALLAAYEMGYYDQSRDVTREDLGDRLGITGRAASKRLRRGTSNLIESTLVEFEDSV